MRLSLESSIQLPVNFEKHYPAAVLTSLETAVLKDYSVIYNAGFISRFFTAIPSIVWFDNMLLPSST